MIKQTKLSFINGMSQDISNSKSQEGFYFNALNLSITNFDSNSKYLLSNLKGNKLELTIPDIFISYLNTTINYNNEQILFSAQHILDLINGNDLTISNQIIIGGIDTKDSLILFTTNNSIDCIWEVNDILDSSFNIELKYIGKLNFSTEYPIQALYNFENDKIQKIYFVDGNNQLRFFNKEDVDLLTYDENKFNIVSEYLVSQIELLNNQLSGTHTSGVIQYAYNLYDLYGSQTTLSPISEIFQIDKGLTAGGGDLNEEVGKALQLKIPKLDNNFKYIKIYAIKYTSYNELPEISLIIDESINTYSNYTFLDNGNKIKTISLDELIFLGGNLLIPKHIESKHNRLFMFNIKEKPYELEIDTRAYGHNNSGICNIRSNVSQYTPSVVSDVLSNIHLTNYNVPNTFDSINYNYDIFKYQSNGTTLGAEGKFIKVEIVKKTLSQLTNPLKYNRFLKDNEIYRIGIKFYNKLGQYTEAKWICDIVSPDGNLEGNYNTLKVSIKQSEFNNYINSLNLTEESKPTGFKVLRAIRRENDKTIISQGAMTGMFLQTTSHITPVSYFRDSISNRSNQSKLEVKQPVPISRTFADTIQPLKRTKHLSMMNEVDASYPSGWNNEQYREIYTDDNTDYKRQHSWQYTKMFQLYSPEVLFGNQTYSDGLQLKLKGIVKHTGLNYWYKRLRLADYNYSFDLQFNNPVHLFQHTNANPGITGFIPAAGLFGPPTGSYIDDFYTRRSMGMFHINRQYNQFVKNQTINNTSFAITGKPEVTKRGQDITYYNNNAEEKYRNTFVTFLTDERKAHFNQEFDSTAITTMQSEGNKCLTLMTQNTMSLEDLFYWTGLNNIDKDGLLFGEITYIPNYKYAGVVYNGQSYEQKKTTSYIEIGKLIDFTDGYISNIESPGDTYVQTFKFERVVIKDSPEVPSENTLYNSEIIEFPVETTINLSNRNDLSLQPWNNKFEPKFDEYHNYNKVYSQEPNILYNFSDNIKIAKINTYGNKILASKLKIPGEFIDNWTDVLVNEEMYLDGKYGSINGTVNYKDRIFTFQDSAIAFININPRIQIQDQNNIELELGTGNVLHEYRYLTTTSGSLNKWGIIQSPTGIYYTDLLNKTLYKLQGDNSDFADIKAMDSFFNKNLNLSELKHDNPILKQGVTGIYDEKLKLTYLTYLQDKNNFTISIKDNENKFNSFHSFYPNKYFSKGDLTLSTDENSKNLYSYYTGEYNKYFNNKFLSKITLLINPDADHDKVFNNIFYNSEVYLNDLDIPNITFNYIKAYNDYQTTNKIPLVVGLNSNLRRKFREWRAIIPRIQNSRDRVRNPWIFLELEFDYSENYKFKLHDIYINYTI